MILAVSSLILVGTGMGGIILDMGGHTRLKLLNSILRLATFLALDLLLIPRWGVVGAAVAALAGESLVNLLRLGEVYYLFRLLPYNRSFLRLGAAALVALTAALLVGRRWPPGQNLAFTAINAAVLLAVYTALTLKSVSYTHLDVYKRQHPRSNPKTGSKASSPALTASPSTTTAKSSKPK